MLLEALARDHRQADLSSSDRVMLDYVVKLTETPARITGADVDALRESGFDRIFAEQLQKITDALHEVRPGRVRSGKGRTKAPRQDTLFLVMLATLATLGDAVAGDSMYKAVGLDKAGGQAFRRWLATLVRTHLNTT